MPIDPTISLKAGAGLEPQGILAGNPIDTMGRFAQIQNALNQNRLFQQTFAARQQAGEIIAAAPNLEAGLQQLYQNPQTAAFAGEVVNSVRQSQLTMLQMQGEQQKQGQSGMEGVLKALPSIYNNPTNQQWQSSMSTALAPLSPIARERAMSGIESIRQGIMTNLPADSQAANAAVRQRIGAMMLGGGVQPEMLRAVTGVPTPAVAFQPVGPGGATVPVQTGGPVLPLMGQGGGAAVSGGGASTGGIGGNALLGAPGPGGSSLPGPQPIASTASGGPVSGPSLTQQQYLTKRGGDMADYQKSLDQNVETGGLIMRTVQEARDTLGDFKPGAGASTYQKIAGLAQGLGVRQDLVDKIGNGDYASAQEFQKLMVNTTMGQIRSQLQGIGGSRLSQMEFATFQQNNPNIDTDPRAINKIFNFWTKLYQYDRDEQREMNTYLKRPGADVSSWPSQWADIAQKKGYILPSVTALGQPTGLGAVPPQKGSNELAGPPGQSPAGVRPPINSFTR